ncbi:hypothetical protein ACGH6Q_11580 [Gilliamella sp. BG2]|uniref:hypothetical protein n=1 Tax=Gilliamella sp. BG2 TaxID=3351509 RepID=UPI003985C261
MNQTAKIIGLLELKHNAHKLCLLSAPTLALGLYSFLYFPLWHHNHPRALRIKN